jgi:membrane-associated phospholipid phosphatase
MRVWLVWPLLLTAACCLVSAQTPPSEPQPDPIRASDHLHPGLKEFPRELLQNFRALVSTQNLAPLALGAAATAVAKVPNTRVESFFGGKSKYLLHEPGDYMGSGWVSAPAIAGLLLVGQKSDDRRFRSFTYSLAQGYVINQSIVLGLKTTVGSQRPNGENSMSFPSGHTAGAFTWATTVSHYYGLKAGIPAYLAATYVGFARLDDRAHRLTDVVAGAAIGYIVGKTVSRRANPGQRLDWNVVVPPGGGVGFSLQYRLPWCRVTEVSGLN